VTYFNELFHTVSLQGENHIVRLGTNLEEPECGIAITGC